MGDLIDHIGRRFGITPTTMAPQKRPTSRPIRPILDRPPVRLLVGPLPLPVVYTKSGVPAKRQPQPMQVGDTAYVKLMPDGLLKLVPFERAGSGYELVTDAEEGVHFEFV